MTSIVTGILQNCVPFEHLSIVQPDWLNLLWRKFHRLTNKTSWCNVQYWSTSWSGWSFSSLIQNLTRIMYVQDAYLVDHLLEGFICKRNMEDQFMVLSSASTIWKSCKELLLTYKNSLGQKPKKKVWPLWHLQYKETKLREISMLYQVWGVKDVGRDSLKFTESVFCRQALLSPNPHPQHSSQKSHTNQQLFLSTIISHTRSA